MYKKRKKQKKKSSKPSLYVVQTIMRSGTILGTLSLRIPGRNNQAAAKLTFIEKRQISGQTTKE